MFSPPSTTRVTTDSLGSNSESLDSITETSTSVDFNPEDYINGLLECGLKEERFRIDRKKLEDMLQVQQNQNSNAVENAEDFFQRVMLETATQISWPSKLKIGAKSKKDPHVKIVGKPESVQMAKELILEILDTKKNRVTLKMDVSHSDHSYIIGKGGFKIQQVMEETGCHIHFPDSNRNSAAEKSNQVSIAGQASGVEMARSKIRDLLPLVFMFELPNGETVNPGEECSPAIQHIQQTYSFNVAFKAIGLGRTLLVVRGCQRLLSRLRQGLALLMEYLTGSKMIPVMGFMKTEIAAQHHQFVMGSCNANTQMIMSKTGATIIFPEATPAFGDTAQGLVTGHSILRSKSTIIIQGSFDSVCLAWQELLKCLPLVLMFDLREGQELDPVMINHLMETYNINIMVRPKTKDNTKSVLVRGAEKDSKILFQVRKEILGLEEEDVSYKSSNESDFSANTNFAKFSGSTQEASSNSKTTNEPTTPSDTQTISTAESLNLLTYIIQQNPQILGLLNNLSYSSLNPNVPVAMPTTSPNRLYRNNPSNLASATNNYTKDINNWINRPDKSYAFSEPCYHKDSVLNGDDIDSEGSMASYCRYSNGFESRSDISSQPESSASSTSSNDATDFKSSRFFRNVSHCNEPPMSGEMKYLADYENKKLVATKAMQQSIGDDFRTPTTLWSGYGFSKSTPDYVMRAKMSAQNSTSENEVKSPNFANACKSWNRDAMTNSEKKSDSPLEQVPSPFSLSNFWENIPQQHTPNYSSIKSLEQLLNLLDLEKYKDVFDHHEIDFSTFLSLTDMDLQQMNISYGARRKMLVAINALREHRSGSWSFRNFRAAPGAERTVYSKFSENSLAEGTKRM